ncbi:hypothetical protein M514_05355 [Trichuris suis]|uniref:Uncharacterized protein n=1 Tax=Trichuris suis TaxID=68888 RepID=A0A085NQ97_9BILA|nr:hypothetical protein M513_05355 [Trichuris suis]KFD71643.1 hypothetical protein M514_05355 [Trichuris suis]
MHFTSLHNLTPYKLTASMVVEIRHSKSILRICTIGSITTPNILIRVVGKGSGTMKLKEEKTRTPKRILGTELVELGCFSERFEYPFVPFSESLIMKDEALNLEPVDGWTVHPYLGKTETLECTHEYFRNSVITYYCFFFLSWITVYEKLAAAATHKWKKKENGA